MSNNYYSRIVFCDFDATITIHETLRAVFNHFIPDVARDVLARFDKKQINLRQALIALVEAIPSRRREDIIQFIANEPVRDGFGEFLDYLRSEQIPFVVVSSGFGFYIEALLKPWRNGIHAIHALNIDCRDEYMRLIIDHNHPTDAMPKERVIRTYESECRIAIGDSVSDFLMAQAADFVFARDSLLREVTRLGKAHSAFDTFFDIREFMKQNRGNPCHSR